MLGRSLLLAGAMTLSLLAAWAATAAAHVCVLFIISVSGPHVHIVC